jgi:hypothetical protein
MVAVGTLTDPDIVPLVPPSQIPVSVIGKLVELFAVSVEGGPFSQPLFLTVTPLATILQITVPVAGEQVAVPGERRSITAPPLETSTLVVLTAVSAQELLAPVPELTHVLRAAEIVFVQPVQTGPARVPAESYVFATDGVAVSAFA